MSDPVSDMLTRIRNAQQVKHSSVKTPYFNMGWALAGLLEKKQFIKQAKKVRQQGKRFIKIYLDYGPAKQPAIKALKRISKPGQRIYKKAKELRPVRQGYGVGIISTSKGLLTDKQARKKNVGGEVVCHIW